jgi:hypothetical protein
MASHCGYFLRAPSKSIRAVLKSIFDAFMMLFTIIILISFGSLSRLLVFSFPLALLIGELLPGVKQAIVDKSPMPENIRTAALVAGAISVVMLICTVVFQSRPPKFATNRSQKGYMMGLRIVVMIKLFSSLLASAVVFLLLTFLVSDFEGYWEDHGKVVLTVILCSPVFFSTTSNSARVLAIAIPFVMALMVALVWKTTLTVELPHDSAVFRALWTIVFALQFMLFGLLEGFGFAAPMHYYYSKRLRYSFYKNPRETVKLSHLKELWKVVSVALFSVFHSVQLHVTLVCLHCLGV